MKKNIKNIVIMVLSGAYNLGDELILRAEIDFFRKKFPNASISVATYDEKSFLWNRENIDFFSFFPNGLKKFPFRNMAYFLKNIVKIFCADIIVIGGGGIFFDNEAGVSFRKNLFEWKLRLFFARLFRKKVIFFGISIEVRNTENQKKLAKIFRKKDSIFVRDERSAKILQKYQVDVTVLYDSVFLMPPTPWKKSEKIKKIGISLRPWFFKKNNVEEVSKFVSKLSNDWYEIVFLSHSLSPSESHNDAIFVKNIFGEQYFITTSLEETFQEYSNVDVVIAMRLHSAILASQFGIPLLMIAYWPKTLALAEVLHLSTVVASESISYAELEGNFNDLKNNFFKMQDEIFSKYSKIHTNFLQKIEKIDII